MVDLNVDKYKCPFCDRWHVKGSPEFVAHFPNDREQEILLNRKVKKADDGSCVSCGKKAVEGKSMCEKCSEYWLAERDKNKPHYAYENPHSLREPPVDKTRWKMKKSAQIKCASCDEPIGDMEGTVTTDAGTWCKHCANPKKPKETGGHSPASPFSPMGSRDMKKSLPTRISEFVSKELSDEEADAKDKAEREKHMGGLKVSCYFCGKTKYTNAKDPNKIKFECPKCRATSYRWEYIR